MVLPKPQLPQSVHDVTIDNIPSRPIDSQHSWTYPGLGCGLVLRPQFAQAVLYSQAQYIAFYKATHLAQVTGPLVRTAREPGIADHQGQLHPAHGQRVRLHAGPVHAAVGRR